MAERSLNLKNQDTYDLANRVATLTGESMTQAVTVSLRERLMRLEPSGKGASLADDLMAIGADCASRLSRKTKHIDHGKLLYDKRGLPKRFARWLSTRPPSLRSSARSEEHKLWRMRWGKRPGSKSLRQTTSRRPW